MVGLGRLTSKLKLVSKSAHNKRKKNSIFISKRRQIGAEDELTYLDSPVLHFSSGGVGAPWAGLPPLCTQVSHEKNYTFIGYTGAKEYDYWNVLVFLCLKLIYFLPNNLTSSNFSSRLKQMIRFMTEIRFELLFLKRLLY